jgi:hypothetical protein
MADKTYSTTSFAPIALGAQHMVGKDIYEPQRTNNFEIQFPGLGTLVSAKGDMKFTDPGNKITLAVKSVGDLQQSIDAISVHYGNNAIKFAGKPTLNDISIGINDFIGMDTERILEAWSSLVYNKYTQAVGRASIYKTDAYLLEFAPDGTHVKAWKLEGCWPGTITYGGFNQEGANAREISMTLNVDFAYALDYETNSEDFWGSASSKKLV